MNPSKDNFFHGKPQRVRSGRTVTWHGPMGPMQIIATGDVNFTVSDKGEATFSNWNLKGDHPMAKKKPKKSRKY